MQYVAILYGDERVSEPASEAWQAALPGYGRFGQLAGEAIVGGGALEGVAAAATVRSDDGSPLVTDGPFAEGPEVVGGFYVLDAASLDDAIELVRTIPAAEHGAVELRPTVHWHAGGPGGAGDRYLALLWGVETEAEVPGTEAWERGTAEHGAFAQAAGDAFRGGAALHPAAAATTVRVRDGELLLTDGPYGETAEVVGGLYVLAAPDRRSATELAARIPVAEGGAVELRPMLEMG